MTNTIMGIITALFVLGVSMFVTTCVASFFLKLTTSHGGQWWEVSAWMASWFAIIIPMYLGSFALALYTLFAVCRTSP